VVTYTAIYYGEIGSHYTVPIILVALHDFVQRENNNSGSRNSHLSLCYGGNRKSRTLGA